MEAKKRGPKQFNPERLQTLAYFDADAASRYAPIARRTFYQAIADGKLPAFRIGGNGRLVVKREDLERFITGTPVESSVDQIVEETLAELAD